MWSHGSLLGFTAAVLLSGWTHTSDRETAADENSTAYFPLLDRIAEGYFDDSSTTEATYLAFLRLLQEDGHLTDAESLSSFQFALSIHSTAPRIEAHYQYYKTSAGWIGESAPDDTCESWVLLDGQQYCEPELDRRKGISASKEVVELPFDRILGDAYSDVPSVLYTDITSPSFRQFHKIVSSTARAGKSSYRVRYKHQRATTNAPLSVNGFGVELALKRTDYIVIDDRQAEQKQPLIPVDGTQEILADEEIADLKPLSSSELLRLDVKAASFVLGSEHPLNTLVKLIQDFPKYTSAIAATNASVEFLAEHRANRDILLPPGFNAIWINGVQVMARDVDAFSLLDHLRRERRMIKSVRQLGFTGKEAIGLLSHSTIAEAQADQEPQRYDFRDEVEGGNVIMWLNDIERDKRYEDWPDHISSLLQRTYPGQLPSVRKDIHNLVIPVDFTKLEDVLMVADNLQGFVKRKVPIRFGLVPSSTTDAAEEQAKVVYHLMETYGLSTVMSYLDASLKAAGKRPVNIGTSSFDRTIKNRKLRRDQSVLSLQEVLKSEKTEEHVVKARNYLSRLGATGAKPPIFINGVAVPRTDEWLQVMSNRVTLDARLVQRAVFDHVLTEESYVPDYLLAQAASRRNPLVIPEDEKDVRHCNLGEIYSTHKTVLDKMLYVAADEDTVEGELAHLLVVGDFDTSAGLQLFSEATRFRTEHDNVEIAFIHSPSGSQHTPGFSTRLFLLVKQSSAQSLSSVEDLIKDPLESDGTNLQGEIPNAAAYWRSAEALVGDLGLQAGQSSLVLNGRLVGPISPSTSFVTEDFESLLAFERKKRLAPASAAIRDLHASKLARTPKDFAVVSNLIALSTISDVPEGIFESAPTVRMAVFNQWNSSHTLISTGDIESATIQVVASIDPASELAQRWTPILKVLSELAGVHMRLFLNPRDTLEELPVKRFYRHVLDSKPSFEGDGSLRDLSAHFSGIPAEALLTMAMDVPPSWLVTPNISIHDLDNIKLSALKGHGSIEAIYELENILIEGHSRDVTLGPPPRGAQLVLGTDMDPHAADTIIMANLGYFQFKVNPGYFNIGLQAGRTQEIFKLESAGTKGYAAQPGDNTTAIALTSFRGATVFPRLSRRSGMEEQDVLETTKSTAADLATKVDSVLAKSGLKGVKIGDYISRIQKIGSGLLSRAGLTKAVEATGHADINIFSVASGHLYERMLNIMMVSVMKHTQHTVKFWFIEQFLSPSFKDFLPTLAEEYGFRYEMVTYKWPHWLRGQKEKQREIWGYKILFLDVLFPLDLDKVVFVDADQIVRTDMYELVQHDLKGAPYGFTPMCDSRTEMEGFRFWKQGYWKNFLRGLPYHISALYVVDLRRFRQIAAGDRLRQQYHQLSADPASLSNLDQDLPNHMQMALPIHSLPQEWLWCETWCSDESLKDAKTIDLCNNPQTKEPKLDRARRQVPEWTAYDEEIAALARRKAGGDDGAGGGAPIAGNADDAGAQVEDDTGKKNSVVRSRDEL
ncbi:killer toxin resistant protein [Elasticomyces elasticus]|nr:killer toxin resistant protein [Elasticomyces elasticus]